MELFTKRNDDYSCVVITVFRIMDVSVVSTFATGAATTSCDTNHADSLLKDGGDGAASVLSAGLCKTNKTITKQTKNETHKYLARRQRFWFAQRAAEWICRNVFIKEGVLLLGRFRTFWGE